MHPLPAWSTMWIIAGALFLALKLATLRGCGPVATRRGVAAYLLAWPGMNAPAFLRPAVPSPCRPANTELWFGVAKTGLGLVLAGWATVHAGERPDRVIAWVGMLGLIFTLHFGCFHVVSWLWRRAGRTAPPIMRAPVVAHSLAEFWGERWNFAFADAARRFVLRPLARRWGATFAGAFVFLVSGLVHEIVISLPAKGGWGGPTTYFLIQGAGAWAEKTPFARRHALTAGWPGRAWTLAVTALPLPLLFHSAFAERVIVPLFHALKELP